MISALEDGLSRLPPAFWPGLDICQHGAGLADDGTVHIPTGCFLVRGAGRTILVDAGLGPISLPHPDGAEAGAPMSEGGRLPEHLRSIGCQPEDIDTVVLTHLHGDHIGWIAPAGVPYFTSATVVLGAADWEPLVVHADPDAPGVAGLEAACRAGRIDGVTATSVPIAPGIDLEHAPGHTPGSYVVVISSGGKRAYLLGDVVQHPLQLDDRSISFLTDGDAAAANRTRVRLLRRLEREGAAIGMNHFPGAGFQRIVPGPPRLWRPIA